MSIFIGCIICETTYIPADEMDSVGCVYIHYCVTIIVKEKVSVNIRGGMETWEEFQFQELGGAGVKKERKQ